MLALLEAELPAPAAGVFTTRSGGLSEGPYRGLNLAGHVDDDPERVRSNRRLLAGSLGLQPFDLGPFDLGPLDLGPFELAFAQQVHGRGVAVLDRAPAPDPAGTAAVAGVDALVTRVPGLALVVLAADCLLALLADPEAGVVAAAHAGRQGLAAGVLQATLAAMVEQGAAPARVSAVLGPAICGRCYELPERVADEVAAAVPGSRCTTRWGTPSVDLAAGAAAVLAAAGVGAVRRVDGCTLEEPDRFYSYRRDGVTGRHAALVRLLA